MTDGQCLLCGETYTKRGMTRHLRSCLADRSDPAAATTVHLRIGRGDYWMHVVVGLETPLETLDQFLRDRWLECCNHMSGFTIADTMYEKPHSDDQPMGYGVDRQSMNVPFEDVLGFVDEGEAFTHEYDFGTTTELSVRVVDEGSWDVSALEGDEDDVASTYDGLALLSRNEPPAIECGACGDPAAKVCQSCLWERGPEAWLCDECAATHEDDCDRPMFLPRINSPRAGVCGYTG